MRNIVPEHLPHDMPAGDGGGPPHGLLGRLGALEVRLARGTREVEAAQMLRHSVFRGGTTTAMNARDGRDADRFDEACDHLLVIDTARESLARDRIVGTYRLLRQECASLSGGFYSSGEFELERLIARHPSLRFLELGRSCVLPQYRSKRTIELLWQGIWAYVNHFGIDVLTGCASFQGTVPAAHAEALSFLAQGYVADGEWRVAAVSSRYHPMDLMPPEAVGARSALAAMPPLMKGYLRLGAKVGDGCVVDHDFGTTDVLIVLPVRWIAMRYINYYGPDATRFAA